MDGLPVTAPQQDGKQAGGAATGLPSPGAAQLLAGCAASATLSQWLAVLHAGSSHLLISSHELDVLQMLGGGVQLRDLR